MQLVTSCLRGKMTTSKRSYRQPLPGVRGFVYLRHVEIKDCVDDSVHVFVLLRSSFYHIYYSHRLRIVKTYVFFFGANLLLSKMASGQGSKYWPSITTFLCHSCPKYLVTSTCLQLNPIASPGRSDRDTGAGATNPAEMVRRFGTL